MILESWAKYNLVLACRLIGNTPDPDWTVSTPAAQSDLPKGRPAFEGRAAQRRPGDIVSLDIDLADHSLLIAV